MKKTSMTTATSRLISVPLLYLLRLSCYFHSLTAQPTAAPVPAPSAPKTLPPEEIAALMKIDSELNVGWDFSVNPCNGNNGWVNSTGSAMRNVTCDCTFDTSCHVTNILLKSQNLVGSLPAEFSNLTSLIELDLTRNYISGSIPPEWGSLPLVKLSLLGNRISGQIPEEIGNISTIESLVLENNLLHGSIPSSLGRLKNLTRLIISANDFTGELPDSLGNLTNLITFRIDGSGISGKIPAFIGNWTKLDALIMQGTSLEGPFPLEFSALQRLTELRVSDLKNGRSFPPLDKMTKLKYLVMRNCSISGNLPAYIGENMIDLKVLLKSQL